MFGTVTIGFEGTEDEVQEMTERIIAAVEALELPVNITEDSWDEDA